MAKILEYVYYGSVHVVKAELTKFCNVVNQLDIATFTKKDIKFFLKNVKTDKQTSEFVYHNRGELFADGFKELLIEDRMFDVTFDVLDDEGVGGMPIQGHRIALSVGSLYFKETLKAVGPTTAGTIGM